MSDLVATAAGVETLTTFVAALEACELSDTLRASGPFTLFAPIDAAFGSLPPTTMQQLYADLPQLAAILSYHIVPGLAMAADLMEMHEDTTLQGQMVTFANADGIRVNGVHITQADIEADNGVIHTIEALLPPFAEADE
jgi:uncharacterized surface protein with fasciclin (FAS1) repeats